MQSNLYLAPTPYLTTATGQFAGYIAPNVLLDESGTPLTDENGFWLTEN